MRDEDGDIRKGEIMKHLLWSNREFGLYLNNHGEPKNILSGKMS